MSDPFKDVGVDSSSVNRDCAYWIQELELSRKRERKWRKDADRVVKIYEAARRDENSYNILFANTDTLLPSCYNQLPRPFVDRRFHDEDQLGKFAARALERALSALQDTGDAEYAPFDNLMTEAVLSALLPGRGLTWFKYDAHFVGEPPTDDVEDLAGGAVDEEQAVEVPGQERVEYETVCGCDMGLDDVLFGYAKSWEEMPWMSRVHEMTKDDAGENFGRELAEKLSYLKSAPKDELGRQMSDEMQEENRGPTPVCEVHEIWIKSRRKVIFIAPDYPKEVLKELDDPYGLSGFFPCPKPLRFLLKKTSLTPTTIYKTYEEQAKELNRVTQRINALIAALKVRGFYDGSIQGLRDLMNKGDNTLLEAKNTAAMREGQTLDRSIWFMPIDKIITVLQQLYLQREQVKGVIYEITGISDIMRGDTQASETFGAQNLKSQWGTLRLKKMQKLVQVYVRDCLRVMGELAGKHFSLETFAGMTDLDYARPEEVQQAQQMMQAVQQMTMMMGPPQPGPDGQPQPPQLPPQAQQAQQQAQAILAKPQWSQVIELLRNDLLRNYRIDIETNSTIDPNTSEDKAQMNEALQALSSMYQSFLPAVQAGALTMAALKSMLLTVARRFQFGREVEDALTQMPEQLPPPPPDPKVDEALAKQKMDGMAQQVDIEKAKGELSMREAALAMKEKQVGQDIEQAKDAVAQTAKEALSEQKIQQKEFLLAMEERLAKHELETTKAVTKQQLQTADSVQKVKGALSDHKIKVKETAAKTMQSSDDAAAAVKELMAYLAKPAKATRDKDGAVIIQR